jgi:hypothetical protein
VDTVQARSEKRCRPRSTRELACRVSRAPCQEHTRTRACVNRVTRSRTHTKAWTLRGRRKPPDGTIARENPCKPGAPGVHTSRCHGPGCLRSAGPLVWLSSSYARARRSATARLSRRPTPSVTYGLRERGSSASPQMSQLDARRETLRVDPDHDQRRPDQDQPHHALEYDGRRVLDPFRTRTREP